MLSAIYSGSPATPFSPVSGASAPVKQQILAPQTPSKGGIRGAKDLHTVIKHLIDLPVSFRRASNIPLFSSPFKSYELEKITQLFKSIPERPWMKDKKYQEKKLAVLQEIFEELHRLTKDRPELKSVREMKMVEVLSKEFAGLDATVGQKIKLPLVDKEGKCQMVEYVVSHKLQLEGTNIPVIVLKPQEEGFSPIVLFRSTSPYSNNEGGFRAIFENADPKGVARTLYEKTLPKFTKIMGELNAPRVIGYSQGGALAQRLIVDFSEKLSKRESSFVYNAAGIEKDYKAVWESIPEEKRPPLENIVVSHDIVSKVGEQIGTITEIEPKERGELLAPHFDLQLFVEGWNAYAVDEKAEARALDRKLLKMLMTSKEVSGLYKAIIGNFGFVDFISNIFAPVA